MPGFTAPEECVEGPCCVDPVLYSSVDIFGHEEMSEGSHLGFCFLDSLLDFKVLVEGWSNEDSQVLELLGKVDMICTIVEVDVGW